MDTLTFTVTVEAGSTPASIYLSKLTNNPDAIAQIVERGMANHYRDAALMSGIMPTSARPLIVSVEVVPGEAPV